MGDLGDHAADLGRVVDLDALADAAQAQRAQCRELTLVSAVAALALDERDGAHAGVASSASVTTTGSAAPFAFSAGLSAAPSALSLVRPSTWLIERPRSAATS